MSCSSSNNLAIAITFFLTAIFSSIFTLVLTLLLIRVYIKRSGLTRKESVKPVEQTSHKRVQGPYAKNPVPLAADPAYELVDHY